MNVPLSPQELQSKYSQLASGRLPVVDYQKVIDAKSIHDVFPQDTDCIVIFYPAQREEHPAGGTMTMGHFTCLIRNMDLNTFFFYDPLAYKIDGYKKFTNRRKLYVEQVNSLVRHFIDAIEDGWSVDYNNHQHQSRQPKVATCGRWCIFRCMDGCKELTNDGFHKIVGKMWNQFFPGKRSKLKDALVVEIVK